MSHIDSYMNYLLLHKAELADTLLLDYVYAVEQAIEAYLSRKLIIQTSKSLNDRFGCAQFAVNENKDRF